VELVRGNTGTGLQISLNKNIQAKNFGRLHCEDDLVADIFSSNKIIIETKDIKFSNI